MKYVNFWIGLVLFSLVITLFLAMAGTMGKDYESRDSAIYSSTAGSYQTFMGEAQAENNTGVLGQIQSQLKGSQFNIVSSGIAVSEQVVNSGQLMLNSVGAIS